MGAFRKALTAVAGLVLACAAAGTASASAGPAVLAFHPAPFDYGPLPVGLLAARTLTLANIGDRASSALTVRLSGSAAFTITADGCTGKSLGPGKTCTVRVRFAPAQVGTVTATLRAVSKNRAATATGALAGTGGKGAGSGSGQHCTIDFLGAGWYTICFRVEGQGLRVETATAWMVNNSLRNLEIGHLEIIGPAGHILNCNDFSADTGQRSPDCTWEPHADVTGGNYCAKLWEWDSTPPAHWFQRGSNTCVLVHP